MTGTDPGSVHGMLLGQGLTVAVAESLTGGLLSAALSSSPGSSETFRGGLVVYATDLKALLAGVPEALLDSEGPVSPDVAAALARGARERLRADVGLGITGVAGPDPVGEHQAGTVFLAVSGVGISEVSEASLTGSRAEIRAASVEAALAMLVSVLAPGRGAGMPNPAPSVTPRANAAQPHSGG